MAVTKKPAKQNVTMHADLAAAVGAWVAAEMRACMANPREMLAGPREMLATEGPANLTKFNTTAFCQHIDGMLDDLVELCALPALGRKYKGGVYLIIVPPNSRNTDLSAPDNDFEWQWGLCGHARMEKTV